MCVNVSASHNIVQDLSDMPDKNTLPRIYFALFERKHQVSALKEAMGVLHLPISGVLLDESLIESRRKDLRDGIIQMSKNCGYPIISLEDIKNRKM